MDCCGDGRMMKSSCTVLHTNQESINSCCHQHDVQYGVKGTMSRSEADAALRECIKANGRPVRALVIWGVVRCFGFFFFRR
jgi:hypothetical protein